MNYREMRELGLLTRTEHGNRMHQLGNACFADMTNPAARRYVWQKIHDNYRRYGIRVFWLDEAEPEFTRYEFEHYRYWLRQRPRDRQPLPARIREDGL